MKPPWITDERQVTLNYVVARLKAKHPFSNNTDSKLRLIRKTYNDLLYLDIVFFIVTNYVQA